MSRSSLAVAGGLALVAGLTMSACATFDPNAATVNGTEINRRDFEDDLNALRDNEAYVNAAPTQVEGELVDSTSTAFAAQTLTNTILFSLVDNEVQARGLTVDPAVQDVASQLVAPALLGADTPNAEAIVQELPDDIREQFELWTGQAITLALDVNDLSAASLPQYYEDNREQFEEICLAAVPAATVEDANAAIEALEGGAEIGTVVAQYGEPGVVGPNGELDAAGSCFRLQELGAVGQEFLGTAPGDLVGPLDLSGLSVVFVVNEPETAGFEAVQPELLASLLSSDAYVAWQQEAAASADVSVDPRYGSWDGSIGAVVAPGVASTPPVVSTA